MREENLVKKRGKFIFFSRGVRINFPELKKRKRREKVCRTRKENRTPTSFPFSFLRKSQSRGFSFSLGVARSFSFIKDPRKDVERGGRTRRRTATTRRGD